MSNVGYATLQVIPSMQGIEGRLAAGLAGPMRAAGEKSGDHLATGLGNSAKRRGRGIGGLLASHIGLGFAALGVGSIVKSSVQLEASFSKTLAQIAVATGAPKSAMKGLHDEALKMGAQTVFSANEAADAMLELGKSGISTRDIMGGGLKGTLTLAAAGSLELGAAATIASNAMNTFNLHGRDMPRIAAALAGGANASTASVQSLGDALAQVGPGARNAGLDLQETVGTLAAFDQAGIKGSDAGTSLKTMLTRLIPSTTKAKDEMAKLGLSFVDSKGNIDDITTVAQKLQDRLKGLSQEQRNAALQTIFGSDATRAATVLMNDGAKGLEKFITATKDQSAAQKMARANMSGTAGALERLKGAAETAKLVLGEALAPTVRNLANYLSSTAIPKVSKFIEQMRSGKGAGGDFAHNLGLVFSAAKKVGGVIGNVIGALNGMPDWAKKLLAGGLIGGAIAVKLKLPSLLSSGASLLGKTVGVQKVFETNPAALSGGKGGPGGAAEKGLLSGGAAGAAVAIAAYLGPPLAAALGAFALTHVPGQSEKDKQLNRDVQVGVEQGGAGSESGGGMGLPAHALDFSDSNPVFPFKIAPEFFKQLHLSTEQVSLLKNTMESLPPRAETRIAAINAKSTVKDITNLANKYHLTPKEVRTILQAEDVASPKIKKVLKGLDETNKKKTRPVVDALTNPAMGGIAAVMRALTKTDRTRANPTVGIQDHASGVISGIIQRMNALDGKTSTSYIRTVEIHSIQTTHVSNAQGRALGGYIAGPGTATSDSIPAYLSNGEFVVNAAATRRNLALLHQINAQRFAAGGQVGSGPSQTGGGGKVRLDGPVEIRGKVDIDTGRLVGTMHAIADQTLDDDRAFGRAMRGRRA